MQSEFSNRQVPTTSAKLKWPAVYGQLEPHGVQLRRARGDPVTSRGASRDIRQKRGLGVLWALAVGMLYMVGAWM